MALLCKNIELSGDHRAIMKPSAPDGLRLSPLIPVYITAEVTQEFNADLFFAELYSLVGHYAL